MRQVTANEVRERLLAALNLDVTTDLTSTEAIAGSLRRAAGFLCPCPARTLMETVSHSLRGLVEDKEGVSEEVENTLEYLIIYGDLIEHSEEETGTGTLIYTAPPTFVRRQQGAVLLLGVVPDHLSPLPKTLENQIDYVRYTRRIAIDAIEDLPSFLLELGFIELSIDAWIEIPPPESPQNHIDNIGLMLDAAPPSGEIPGLKLLDSTKPVRFYRGRWVEPSQHTGRFVARREQLYGNPLWCYVEMVNGSPQKFLDLPPRQKQGKGRDSAWQLQAAIDAQRSEPQVFRKRSGKDGTSEVDFFSPVPAWAQRRWDFIGDPLPGSSGCLFSFSFSDSDIEEELNFARERLWLAEIT